MSNVQAVAAALIYLEAQGEVAECDPEARAAILIEQLATRGYVLRTPIGSPLVDRSPANLAATRRRLGLRIEDIAREARLCVNTVQRVEQANRNPHAPSIEAVAAAFARLTARRS